MLSSEFDAGQLLLGMMALTAYPLAFPQLARLATGLSVSDPKFQRQRAQFLRQIGNTLKPNGSNGDAPDLVSGSKGKS
jgi:hypothetical protein